MSRSCDYETKIFPNKPTVIYNTFFEVKNELMNYLSALTDIESHVDEMSFVPNDSVDQ